MTLEKSWHSKSQKNSSPISLGKNCSKKSLPKYHFKLNFQVIPLQFFHKEVTVEPIFHHLFRPVRPYRLPHHWRPDDVVELSGEVSELGRPTGNSWWCEDDNTFIFFGDWLMFFWCFSTLCNKHSYCPWLCTNTAWQGRKDVAIFSYFLVWIYSKNSYIIDQTSTFRVFYERITKLGAPSKTCIFFGWNNFIYEGLQTQLPNYSTQSVGAHLACIIPTKENQRVVVVEILQVTMIRVMYVEIWNSFWLCPRRV